MACLASILPSRYSNPAGPGTNQRSLFASSLAGPRLLERRNAKREAALSDRRVGALDGPGQVFIRDASERLLLQVSPLGRQRLDGLAGDADQIPLNLHCLDGASQFPGDGWVRPGAKERDFLIGPVPITRIERRDAQEDSAPDNGRACPAKRHRNIQVRHSTQDLVLVVRESAKVGFN